MDSDSVGLGQVLGFGMSNKLPGGSDAAGLGSPLEEQGATSDFSATLSVFLASPK